ncbi:hypothetical protein DCAR_0313464 [Daucus carota subsp. sativus]|uniref:Uncharacterized protein n=1 Tax=Daucus carota subsp. sativus TaxID=79200 RepID=A0AAF1AVL7_DAUCS|nr:hypothetical protein DCAR_0313464 [Daucus carota subsp. sativus]
MDDHGRGKVHGIRHIVRLKEILHKWHHATTGHKVGHNNSADPTSPGGISPAINRRLKGCNVYVDLDEENCQSPDPPCDIPKGFLAVYVGPEQRRFIIPTSYLSDPLFKKLLDKVEEEFGFDHCGALTIPCETETFKYLLNCMENHQKEQCEHENGMSLYIFSDTVF